MTRRKLEQILDGMQLRDHDEIFICHQTDDGDEKDFRLTGEATMTSDDGKTITVRLMVEPK